MYSPKKIAAICLSLCVLGACHSNDGEGQAWRDDAGAADALADVDAVDDAHADHDSGQDAGHDSGQQATDANGDGEHTASPDAELASRESWEVDPVDASELSRDEAIDTVYGRMARATCRALYECPESTNPRSMEGVTGLYPPEKCEEHLLSGGKVPFGPEAARSDKTTIDTELTQSCLDELEDMLAGEDACLDQVPRACNDFLQGTLETGEPCIAHAECKDGVCRSDLTGDMCDGECADPLKDGSECGPEIERTCAQGSLCVPTAEGDKRVCAPEMSLPEGHICDTESPYSQCEDGTICLGDSCQPVTYLDVRDPCGGALKVCPMGTECSAGATSTLLCRPYSRLGEPCGSDRTCALTYACEDGSCVERIPEGDSCTETSSCIIGTTCLGGICQERIICGHGRW